jgi:CBS domain-containing protein
MKKREPVSSIMTKNVHSIRVDEPLRKAVEMVKHHKIRHLPVVEGKSVVGIISSTDLNRLTFSGLFDGQEGADEAVLEMLNIRQVMSDNPMVVDQDTSVREVAEIFAGKQFHAVPVTHNGELTGIVTTTDVIKHYLELY